VAAFVDTLEPELTGVHLVNLSRSETRNLIVQAGAFGEHRFTEARSRDADGGAPVSVNSKHFAVTLPPSTSVRLDIGMKRFVNKPTYAFPWHGDNVPVH
jgi:hypothetical protein